MSKSVHVSWEDFAEALDIRLSNNPLEDYGAIDDAYEAANEWIQGYQVDNEAELSEESKQNILELFNSSLEDHWSIAKIMRHNFSLDTWITEVDKWGHRGQQTNVELSSGTAIPSFTEDGAGITFVLDEPFVTAYSEASYAVHELVEGRSLNDMKGVDVAHVINWIASTEGIDMAKSLDLEDWDEHWSGPDYQSLLTVAEGGIIARNRPEDELGPSMVLATARIMNELKKNAEVLKQMKKDEIIDKKADVDETNWEEELRNTEPTGTFDIDPENIGVWVEKSTPDVGDRVQQYAKKFGWDGAIKNDEDEGYYEAIEDAETFLNSKAPAGYFFGTNADGDWGMWEGESSHADISREDVNKRDADYDWMVPGQEDEPKGVEEMTEADMPSALQTNARRYGATVQALMKIRSAQVDPNKVRWGKEGDTAVSKDDTGRIISKVPWIDFERDNPEVAGKVTTASTLAKVSILSEFHDDLYPVVNANIDTGSKVFIKGINRFGEVIRTLDEGGAFRVQAGDTINTYFRQELEVRQASK